MRDESATTSVSARRARRPWLYFVSSLFTSFAWVFYLITVERQRRHQPATVLESV